MSLNAKFLVAGTIASGIGIWYFVSRQRVGPSLKISDITEKSEGAKIRVIFGSQTGTAEAFAKELAEEATAEFGLDCGANGAESVEDVNLDDVFSPETDCRIIVFVLSTYGEGDASDDAVSLDEWLKERIANMDENNIPCPLGHMRVCIFGLGNKQYALYNEMAKRTEKYLVRLGATLVCPTGLGDDNADIEMDFSNWKQRYFVRSLLASLGLDYETVRNNRVVRNPLDKIMLELVMHEKRSKLPFDPTVQSTGPDVLSKFFFASNIVPVIKAENLCEGKRQIDVDITKVPSLRYRTGDTLDVLPVNRDEDVNWLLSQYQLIDKSDFFISFTKKKGISKLTVKKPFPTPCTLHAALIKYLDLRASPTRVLMRDIAVLMGESTESADLRIEAIKARESAGEFMTVLSFLKTEFYDFSSKIKFSDLLQLLPKQKSRAYSICSSPLVDPRTISLVISRVDDNALASTLLCDQVRVNDILSVSLRQGAFRLPTLPNQPVIMIAVGTGFAPFRAFLQELTLKKRIASDRSVLFFGCRRKDEWIYRTDMEEFQRAGGSLHIAFSREDPISKIYVQDLVLQEKEKLKNLVRNGVVYVCGSTQMGLSVMDAFNEFCSVEALRSQKRYIEELWG